MYAGPLNEAEARLDAGVAWGYGRRRTSWPTITHRTDRSPRGRSRRSASGTTSTSTAYSPTPSKSEIDEQFAAYDTGNRDLAADLDEAIEPFTTLVDWWQKEDLQRQMRRTIKQHLRARGLAEDDMEALTLGIVDLAKVRAAP